MNSEILKVASVGVETTGFNRSTFNKAEGHQLLSVGIVVADATTFVPVDEIYHEIKWDGVSEWNSRLESVHGFTREYLERNGEDEVSVAASMANLFLDHFDDSPIVLLGHNVNNFAYWFIRDIFDKYDLDLFVSDRVFDTFTIGKTLFGLNNQDEIFDMLGVKPPLTSLDKARAYLKLFKITKGCWKLLNEKNK